MKAINYQEFEKIVKSPLESIKETNLQNLETQNLDSNVRLLLARNLEIILYAKQLKSSKNS